VIAHNYIIVGTKKNNKKSYSYRCERRAKELKGKAD